MSTLTFTGKQLLLQAKQKELNDLVQELFPVGGPIAWCNECSFTQTGTVSEHRVRGSGLLTRATDRDGFYIHVRVGDILRAQS